MFISEFSVLAMSKKDLTDVDEPKPEEPEQKVRRLGAQLFESDEPNFGNTTKELGDVVENIEAASSEVTDPVAGLTADESRSLNVEEAKDEPKIHASSSILSLADLQRDVNLPPNTHAGTTVVTYEATAKVHFNGCYRSEIMSRTMPLSTLKVCECPDLSIVEPEFTLYGDYKQSDDASSFRLLHITSFCRKRQSGRIDRLHFCEQCFHMNPAKPISKKSQPKQGDRVPLRLDRNNYAHFYHCTKLLEQRVSGELVCCDCVDFSKLVEDVDLYAEHDLPSIESMQPKIVHLDNFCRRFRAERKTQYWCCPQCMMVK